MNKKNQINLDRILDDFSNETPSMLRERPYDGQPWTDAGARGAHKIEGITFRDLMDCYVRAVIMCHPDTPKNLPFIEEAQKGVEGTLCRNDVFKLSGDIDLIAVGQNMTCEVERIMGIFPNVDEDTDIWDDVPIYDGDAP